MRFFITHYTPLIERKSNIIQQFKYYNIIDYEFIEAHDKEVLNSINTNKFSNVTNSEISLFMKHIEIFKKEINDIIIVLEDDAILCDKFAEKLTLYLNNLPENWDILFTADCCNIHADNIYENKYFYNSNKSRGTCMYILNKDTSSKLINIFKNEINISLPIDHWFNYIANKYDLKYFYSEPTLVSQGSEIGIFKSAIR
jgi:GR25 family glycosyltransferase involved in LPS biosynthesis